MPLLYLNIFSTVSEYFFYENRTYRIRIRPIDKTNTRNYFMILSLNLYPIGASRKNLLNRFIISFSRNQYSTSIAKLNGSGALSTFSFIELVTESY